jgi:hypothetical protein
LERPRDGYPRAYLSPINNSMFFGLSPDEHSIASLLTSPVAEELKLSTVQIEKLRSIYDPLARRINALSAPLRSRPSARVDRQRLRLREEQTILAAKLDAAMAEVLDAAQRKRFDQIALQVGGPSTLITESSASIRLGMSDPQRDKLRTIVAMLWVNEVRLKEEYRRSDGRKAEIRRAVQEARETAFRRMIEALNPEQVATLRDLLGEPYDVSKLAGVNDQGVTHVSWWHGIKEEDGGG